MHDLLERAACEGTAQRLAWTGENPCLVCLQLSVDRLDNLEQTDLADWTSQQIAATDATLTAQHATPPKLREELLELGQRDTGAASDLGDGNRLALATGDRECRKGARRCG